jgi:hypothetical protein
MGAQLDLDDVAATSELAKQELAALRAENQRMREALEKISNYDNLMLCGFYAMKIAAAALGKE